MRVQTAHTLTRKQYKFAASTARHLLLSGGVGSGKSLALAYRALFQAINYPGSLGQLSMWTYPQIRDIMRPALEEVLKPLPLDTWIYKAVDKEYHFKNGSVWRLRHLDSEGKVRGTNLDYVCLDELTVGITENVYGQLTARIRGNSNASISSVTNPDSKAHWAYRRWFKEPQPGYEVIRAPTQDNRHLPKEYIDDLSRHSSEWQKQFLNGEWGTLVGAMFDITSAHMVERKPGGKFYLSFDWGYKVDDWVCLLICVEDGHIHVVDEINARLMTNEQLVPRVKAMLQRHGVASLSGFTADNGGELAPPSIRFWRDELKIRYIPTRKKRLEGWTRLQDWLNLDGEGEPGITIEPRCERTKESMQGMRWSEKANDADEGDDHNADALRYFVQCQVMLQLWDYMRKQR